MSMSRTTTPLRRRRRQPPPSEPDEIDADEVFVVKITASYARDFVARAQALVAAGRPSCPFCLQPLDPHGHICPRANGYRPAAVRLNSAVTVDDLGLTEDGDARPPHPALTAELAQAELQITGRLLQASNATFLAELQTAGAPIECVYKPLEGERPLWDFPHRTLGLREVAAYEVSRIGGFDCVPVTVLIDGPFGPGSLQVWVEVGRGGQHQAC